MQLELQYTEKPQHQARAAFIAGASPGTWLAELNRWQVAVESLTCYLVPQSMQNRQAAGLFVVFPAGSPPPVTTPLSLYGSVADTLFLPVHARLFPAVTTEELRQALAWECQFFHPHIGLVGFSPADQVDLASLLAVKQAQDTAWHFAQPGPQAAPRLERIRVHLPPEQDFVATFQAETGTQPLEAIPLDQQGGRLLAFVKKTGNRIAHFLMGILLSLLEGRPARSSPSHQPATPGTQQSAHPGHTASADRRPAIEPWLAWTLAGMLGLLALAFFPVFTLILVAGFVLWRWVLPYVPLSGLLIFLFGILFVGLLIYFPISLLKMLAIGVLYFFISWFAPDKAAAPSSPQKTPPAWAERFATWLRSLRGSRQRTAATGGRLRTWLHQRMDNLERERDQELNRLMKLFDENPEEALKYAIPLDQQYAGRGQAAPGSRLGRRSGKLDVASLGGGAADQWDLGSRYAEIRARYQQTAAAFLEAGNYRRAAYVYAHLLNDFSAAASALEQGKYYREAAVLYRDHLKNKAAAAQCLEKGGLLLEAIDLYLELEQIEKVADLYRQLEQHERAAHYYEQCIQQAAASDDVPEAARIMEEKLQQPDRALQALRNGWADSEKAQICLQGYFDRMAARNPEALCEAIQEVFRQDTPAFKESVFFEVLAETNRRHPSDMLLPVAREIAYEVVSRQAAVGEVSHMRTLSQFLPQDRLIKADLSRFLHHKRFQALRRPASTVPTSDKSEKFIQLDPQTQWLSLTHIPSGFLSLGIRENRLRIARATWDGQIEYAGWQQSLTPSQARRVRLIWLPQASGAGKVWIFPGMGLAEKVFAPNAHFPEEIILSSPAALQTNAIAIGKAPYGVAVLRSHAGWLLLNHFSLSGSSLHTWDCTLQSGTQIAAASTAGPGDIFWRKDAHYAHVNGQLLRIDAEGRVDPIEVPDQVKLLRVSDMYTALRLAVATSEGCRLIWPGENMQVSDPFATDMEDVIDLAFIPTQAVVVAGTHEAVVYQQGTTGEVPQLLSRVSSHRPIISVSATASRGEFALLNLSGRVTVYRVPPS